VEPGRDAKLWIVQEHRRYTRVAATWPVTVRIGDRLLRLQTVNLSAHGVKVGLDAALPPVGTPRISVSSRPTHPGGRRGHRLARRR